jgi:hypothetical protein
MMPFEGGPHAFVAPKGRCLVGHPSGSSQRTWGEKTMQAHIKLGRIFGVQIGLHYSWFFIALLILLSLGGHFTVTYPEWSRAIV